MLRHLTALVLLPAMALAGVTFETDPRPVNRAAPGASYADMLARITPAVVSVRTAEVIPASVLKRYSGRIDPDKVMQDEQTGETLLPTGLGSGTIIHPDGYVITNRHVVLQDNRRGVAKTVIVQLADPDRAAEVSGEVDRTFANSLAEVFLCARSPLATNSPSAPHAARFCLPRPAQHSPTTTITPSPCSSKRPQVSQRPLAFSSQATSAPPPSKH